MHNLDSTFDFSGLGTHPPKSLRVVRADKNELILEHPKREKAFRVIKLRGEFLLQEGPIGQETFNSIMRSDDLGRLLRLLGYGKAVRLFRENGMLKFGREQGSLTL